MAEFIGDVGCWVAVEELPADGERLDFLRGPGWPGGASAGSRLLLASLDSDHVCLKDVGLGATETSFVTLAIVE